MKKIINSDQSLSECIGELRVLYKERKFLEVSVKEQGKKRSLDQNAVLHVWLGKVCKEEREYTEPDLKCLWKLHFGVPILRAEDEEYNQYCVEFIDPLPYEKQLKAMLILPCTSRMTTKQKNRLLETIQNHYAGRVTLEFLKDKNEEWKI